MNQYQKSTYVGASEKDIRSYADIKNNNDALIDPQASDDTSLGYNSGSIWINKLTETAFICISNAKGEAVWSTLGNGGDNSTSAQNVGTGIPLYKEKIGSTLHFKSIASTSSIIASAHGNDEIDLNVSTQISNGISLLTGASSNIQDQLDAIVALLGSQTESTVITSSNSWIQIASIGTSVNTVYQIEAKVVARRIDAQGEGASYVLYATYRRDSGGVSKIGEDKLQLEDTLSWDVDLTSSGTEIILNVKGENLKTISWKAIIKRINI